MNCEMDRITAAFFSLSNAISSSSCICTNALEDGSFHCHFLLCRMTLWGYLMSLYHMDQCLNFCECCAIHALTSLLWLEWGNCWLFKKIVVSEVLANIMSWVSQLLLEMWQKLRTQILSNGLLEFGHFIVYLSIPSFMSWWS
jgi:hypothetical protein